MKTATSCPARRSTLLPELARGYMYKPCQKPRPEIVGTVVAPRYGRGDPASPYLSYWDKLRGNMLRAKRQVVFELHEQMELMASEVMPGVNCAVGVSESGAA